MNRDGWVDTEPGFGFEEAIRLGLRVNDMVKVRLRVQEGETVKTVDVETVYIVARADTAVVEFPNGLGYRVKWDQIAAWKKTPQSRTGPGSK